MNEKIISGIQQIGIGVKDVHKAWSWYKKYFGMDIRVFEEAASAELMLPYTGGKPRTRHAALAVNLQGGGGFEIWQYTDRIPQPPDFELQLGDTGIFAVKIKSKDVIATYNWYKSEGLDLIGNVNEIKGKKHFFVRDPYNNLFQVVEGSHWFKNENKLTGAAYGVIIGASDIDRSKDYYSSILGYDEIVYDSMAIFPDFDGIPGSKNKFRRMLLRHSKPRKGAFSELLGASEIELIQVLDRKPLKIFKDRLWGDLGFIHLCFDINGMSLLREECKLKKCPFTVDTGNSFDMGEAAGAFAYNEDPDGTLIEFVETHKIPVIKKLNFYINLRNRNPEKSLPRWMLGAMSLNRAKDIKFAKPEKPN
jgi:catechol 2,3-dioxygenase-like lactoylglutathione lyase family enzyme